ncbi:lytic transglycosylase domain-containing protein [Pelagibius litoralis]|uniref:Lytic transglycosylase domain-containing protein n=1 Tax=Pelagibius litoralis TaxID=374515 RepID=A0A967C5P6_9PROT|nr:lytic transglycosylase domain-containing protein [Pelagibius litoralis]NIA66987.1 lytic transglycosylase domain-containing protein [Pelagibius litoralis]
MKPYQLVRLPAYTLGLVVLWPLLLTTKAIATAPEMVLSDKDQRLYASAFELMENGERKRGLELARQGGDALATKIADWVDLSDRNSGREFAEIDAFLRSNPQWPRRYQLYRNAELLLPASWSPERVIRWFGNRPPITGVGALVFCNALNQQGDTDGLQKWVPLLWVSLDFDSKDEAQFRRQFGRHLSAEHEQKRLTRLLWDRRTSAARRQLRRVGPDLAAIARARLALYGDKPGVDVAIRKVPKSLQADEGLLYERTAWRQRRNRFEGVIEILNNAPTKGEHLDSWWRLRKWAARRALNRSEEILAYQVSRRHGLTQGLGFAEGEWLAGWISLIFLKRPEEALKHFTTLYDGVTSPISKSRGAFWAGEAHAKLGNATDARRWYALAAVFPATFYGQLAAQRIGAKPLLNLEGLAETPKAAVTAFLGEEVVGASKILGQVNQPRLQQTFFARLRQDAKTKTDFQLVIELANAMDRQDLALRAAKAARRLDIDLGPLLYPQRPLPKASGPEPALVLALMRQESEFYPGARSPVGALGLMQLMPATARQTARGTGLSYDRGRLTSDPDYNLRLGQAYLMELLAQFDGSYILALAAYNAGPTRANRWVKEFGDPRTPSVDPIIWIEKIPFDETRNYVQRILESLMVYRQMNPNLARPSWSLSVSPLSSR